MSGICYAGGGWATNVGNAFYNLGLTHALRVAAGDHPVYFMTDVSAWIWESANSYDPIADVDADLWVFSGPAFSAGIVGYRQLFDRLRARGKEIAFASVGLWEYTNEEWAVVSEFLEPYLDMIRFVSSRDRSTFDRASSFGVAVFDGLCGSMFLPEAVAVPSLDRDPYVVLNFAAHNEPALELVDGRVEAVPVERPRPRRPSAVSRVASRVPGLARVPGIGPRPSPDPSSDPSFAATVGPFAIVRTRSEGFQRSAATVFDRPGLHYYDLPHGALAIYKSAEAVFTDRVHTTAATLVLGGTARYVFTSDRSRDGRWGLLERVGAGAATRELTTLDLGRVADEREAMLAFLSGHLA